MKGRTLTRADLAEAVYQEVGLSRSESAELVDSILAEIGDSLVSDGIVKISSFGTFSVRQKGQRVGRNPKTGEEVPIMPRRVLVFRASQVLKDRINGFAANGRVWVTPARRLLLLEKRDVTTLRPGPRRRRWLQEQHMAAGRRPRRVQLPVGGDCRRC